MQTNEELISMWATQLVINEELEARVDILTERLINRDGNNIYTVKNPAELTANAFEDLIEEHQVYGLRYKGVLISPLAYQKGIRARFGPVTVKTYTTSNYYGVVEIHIEDQYNRHIRYDGYKGIMKYRSEFGTYNYYVDNDTNINMIRGHDREETDFHTEVDHERRISLGHGYTLRFFVDEWGCDRGAIELINPGGDIVLDTSNGVASLYLDDEIHMSMKGIFHHHPPAGA